MYQRGRKRDMCLLDDAEEDVHEDVEQELAHMKLDRNH